MPTHIQIGDITPRLQYTADGAQTAFTYPFPIFKDVDIEVFFNDQKQTSGFTVAGAGNSSGGNVTFAVAPAASVIVTLARRISLQRTSDFQESGTLPSRILNDEMDYLTASLQQVASAQSRSAQLAVTDISNASVMLPTPEANRVLAWNGTANAFVNGPTSDEVTSAQLHATNALASETAAATSASTASGSAMSAASSAASAQTAAASNLYASNVSKAANFVVLPTDDGKQFLIDTTAGNVTVTLPGGSTATDGFRVALGKTSADNNAVIVNSTGTDTINGGTAWQFSVPHGQSVIALDTTPAPDVWFAAGVGLVAPIGVAEIQDNAKPYDIAFVAGFGNLMVAENVAVQTYGELVVPRSITVIGEVGYLDVAAAGQAVILDIEKNGVSIYTTKPQFAVTANALSVGTLATTAFVAGDRLTFKVTQTGTTTVGQGARFTLKSILA